jgi:hypothetical protein
LTLDADNALYALPLGELATFSGDWLRYPPDRPRPDQVHYLDGYVGWLHNRRNGGARRGIRLRPGHRPPRQVANATADEAAIGTTSLSTAKPARPR